MDRSGAIYRSRALAEMDAYDGVLVVDKPAGPTSHDIVHSIRKRFALRKVGHGGTLDPMATGLLVILVGRGTKLADRFTGSDKTYEGIMKLGVETDTQDAEGAVIAEKGCSDITESMVCEVIARFKGDILQVPPMVSAVKVGGVPLYKRARRGETVEREPKLVHVYDFTIRSIDLPLVDFSIKCSKGTYVRTVCSDIGTQLGCGARLEALRRVRSGDIGIADAVKFDSIMSISREELKQHIIPVVKMVC